MTEWSQLSHAYGPADDVPELLDQLAPDGESEVWDELWSRLCHQGSVYSASFAALPRLTEAAARWAPAERITALVLSGSIIAGVTGTREEQEVRSRYGDEIATLLALTEESVHAAEAEGDFIYLLQAGLAFEGVPVWSEYLDRLVDGEFEVQCPDCDTYLFIALGEDGFFACKDDYALKKNVRRTPLLPAGAADLEGLGARLHQAAQDHGHESVATGLRHLFGRATCTECGTVFPIAAEVERIAI